MTGCAQIDRVEELVLGALAPAEAAAVRAHLARCEPCRGAHLLFAEERELLQLRAEALPPLPPLAIAFDALAADDIEPADRRTFFARLVPAVAAAAACIATLTGAGELQRSGGAERRIAAEPTLASPLADSVDEPLACALPVSGVVRVGGGEGELACAASVASDRSTSEEPLSSSGSPNSVKVTCSLAAP
jgi:anti-sigma factor RsiW